MEKVEQRSIRKGKFLREQVYRGLKEKILNGTLPPNKRLIEEKIASEMKTSRTPVREAMQKLEKEGLIRKLPRGGFTISNITLDDIEEVFGLRAILEGYAAALATARATEEDIKSLEEIVAKQEECKAKDGAEQEMIALNTEFHDRLYRAAKSIRLYTIINDLTDSIYRFRSIIFKYPDMIDISIKDHKDMIELMKDKKSSKVETLVRRHIIRGRNLIKKRLKKNGNFLGVTKRRGDRG
ncbi:MAG: GntR family transcriptional regulator [Syntrophorhabdaceae bacterium]|nr:GntR family transcriptional regulator [Syntrophorhabdaceae bacterium]